MTLGLRLRARLARAAMAANGLVLAIVFAALILAACGVKAPPKPVKPAEPGTSNEAARAERRPAEPVPVDPRTAPAAK